MMQSREMCFPFLVLTPATHSLHILILKAKGGHERERESRREERVQALHKESKHQKSTNTYASEVQRYLNLFSCCLLRLHSGNLVKERVLLTLATVQNPQLMYRNPRSDFCIFKFLCIWSLELDFGDIKQIIITLITKI